MNFFAFLHMMLAICITRADCNNRGDCDNDVCYCDPGFEGVNCEISERLAIAMSITSRPSTVGNAVYTIVPATHLKCPNFSIVCAHFTHSLLILFHLSISDLNPCEEGYVYDVSRNDCITCMFEYHYICTCLCVRVLLLTPSVGLLFRVGCGAVLLEVACGAAASRMPPQEVPQVCNNDLVFERPIP